MLLMENQAVECEKCGHLNFQPWVVTVCMHCYLPLTPENSPPPSTSELDFQRQTLCKRCYELAKKKDDAYEKWHREFYDPEGGDYKK